MKEWKILFILGLLALLSSQARAQSVFISPLVQNVSLFSGTSVSVNVSVSGVTGLYGFQYDITYNQTVLPLQTNGVTGAYFLQQGASIFCINNTATPGIIKNIACTRQGATSGVSGSGNLTALRFNLNQVVPTTVRIGISNSKLSDINSQPISHTSTNGTVYVNTCLNGETRECGSDTGECSYGTWTCVNNNWGTCTGGVGPTAEICDNRDNNCDGQVDNGLSRACSLTHQGICAVGTETCSAGMWSGCPSPQLEVCLDGADQDCDGSDSSCMGDVNGDTCVDISDMAAIALDFGKTSGFINPNSDIDDNGIVDIFDLVYVGKDFGSGC